ncbi:MAG: response regulator [Candidatus Omnitrophota bacterium]
MNRKKILIADDDMVFLKFLEQSLAAQGYAVIKAVNGREAFLLAKSRHPDLVVLDISMPVMDDYTVSEIFSQDSDLENIPIIFLTAMVSEQEEQAMGKEIGGCCIMAKSKDTARLLSKIKEMLAPGISIQNKDNGVSS